MEEIVLMKQQLQEKEEVVSTLQTELRQKQEEQAAQLHKNLFEIEDFSLMKKLLQEKQELISTLRIDLRQTQEEQDAQLEELKTLQQQYLLRNQEVIELLPLKAQLQEYQEQAEAMQMMQEELRRESLAWQQELHQLRMEKNTWELHEKWMKEQYIMAIADKDEKLGHLQSLLRSSSQIPILSAQYQRQGPPNGLNPGVPQESNEKRDPEATGETQPRLGHSEVNPPRTSTIGTGGSPETSILIDVSDSSCGRTPSTALWKRILPRSL
ncbi:uncharacterized protein LOC142843728 isoform X3 [Microtus pennsylvanicus]|uniref:uncharacterized protein LOC142843728 isoform X3 n=1 Tax=Microtus pennsylvanicus TaxID=10058 RepID=UPI003F6B699F